MTAFIKTDYKTLVGGVTIQILTPAPTGEVADWFQDTAIACADAIDAWCTATKGISSVTKNGETMTFTYSNNTTQNFTVPDGTQGNPGTSPSASVSKAGTTTTITITDTNGTTTAQVNDGAPGTSPTASVAKVGAVTTLTVTDTSGTTTATVNDGVTGWTEVAADATAAPSFAIEDGKSYQASSESLTSLTLTTGAGWNATAGMARIRFVCPASLTLSYPSTWIAVGDDCSAGVFTPTAGKFWIFIDVRHDETFLTVQKYEVPA